MSLQVWLPLTGDLHNQGLLNPFPIPNTQITGNRFTEAGKIGNVSLSYTTDLSTYATWFVDTSNNNLISLFGVGKKYSIAGWFKLKNTANITNNSSTFVQLGYSTDIIYPTKTYRVFGLWWTNATSGSGPRFVVNNGDYGGAGSIATSVATDYGTWHHIAYSLDNTTATTDCIIYIDGIEVVRKTFTKTNSNCNDMNTTNANNILVLQPHTFCYNDLRIYDHILSAKEVEEISKGLVLHYKLDNNGLGNENLVTGSNTNSTSTNKWGAGSAVGGNSSTIEQDSTGIHCVKITRDNTAQSSWDYLYYNGLLRNKIKTNTKYTISFDCKPSVDGSISFVGFVNGNATNYMTNSTTTIQGNCKANQWNHMVYQCITLNSFNDITVSEQLVYFSRSVSLRGTNVTVLFKNIKVEEGAVETPWCPAITDSLYTSLNGNSNTIYDSSGYNNNGTITGSLETITPSPRYSCATKFNNGMIHSNYGSIGLTNLTYCAWVYLTQYTNDRNCIIIGGTYLTINVNGKLSGYAYGKSPAGYHTGTKTIPLNTWTHVAIVWTDTQIIGYIDGIQDFAVNCSGAFTTLATKTDIGCENSLGNRRFYGNISDVRIYATALTLEQIKELYNTSMTIDNKGNIYARELVEI